MTCTRAVQFEKISDKTLTRTRRPASYCLSCLSTRCSRYAVVCLIIFDEFINFMSIVDFLYHTYTFKSNYPKIELHLTETVGFSISHKRAKLLDQ